MTRNFSIIILLTLFLTSCNSGLNLNKLKRTELKGSKFHNALAKEYLSFSESEAEQYDWSDSAYFADKGLQASYGHDVIPENAENRQIPENIAATIKEARLKLINILTTENKENKADLVARAQMLFDCWVEQQEENWQTEHIDACRDEFFDTLEQIHNPKEKEIEKEITAQPQEDQEYVVFFDFDSWKLEKDAKNIIKEISNQVEGQEQYVDIITKGFSDLVGNDKYNQILSVKRAEAVKKELIKHGFNNHRISAYGYGESEPLVNTVGQEPKNRRVEIIIKE